MRIGYGRRLGKKTQSAEFLDISLSSGCSDPDCSANHFSWRNEPGRRIIPVSSGDGSCVSRHRSYRSGVPCCRPGIPGRLAWRELKGAVHGYNATELSLYRATSDLTFLNTTLREDILNQLTQLSTDLGPAGLNPGIEKMRPAINRIRRQIKFPKEFQDIGANAPEWHNVAYTITRAKAGVNLGKVTFEIDIRDVEIYADRLLEKAFFLPGR